MNGLQMIVRAHECVMDGFERFAQGHLITLFSATNYCGTANNAGGSCAQYISVASDKGPARLLIDFEVLKSGLTENFLPLRSAGLTKGRRC